MSVFGAMGRRSASLDVKSGLLERSTRSDGALGVLAGRTSADVVRMSS